ncbi:MAG: hypothetical protein RLZZ242_1367 [Bacteroidota bacterium]
MGTLGVAAQNTGSLKGRVVDELGYPISGVSVFIEQLQLGAQTDLDGYYIIEPLNPGSYNLTASSLGYQSQTLFNVLVKSKGTQNYNFTLVEKVEALEGVVLDLQSTISRPRETPLSTQTLSAVELATYPGGNNDVVQVAQTLPGVSPSVGGFRNDLIIRGGAPNESVYYLDGVEIPNINHFSTQGSAGGPVGMINVSFIESVTLSASGFGAQYDNPLSGVLQFNQRKGSRSEWNRNIRVSASETALTFDGPIQIGEKRETTFIGSVRRSYLQFLFELIGLPFRPNYWDYQYKIDHKIDERNTLALIGIGAIDDFSVAPPQVFDAERQAQLEQAPFIDQNSHVFGLSWKHLFKENPGVFQLTLSHNRLNNRFTRYSDPENQEGVLFLNDALEAETKLRAHHTQFIGDLKWFSGVNLQHSYYTNSTEIAAIGTTYLTAIDFLKYGAFTNFSATFNERIELSAGFRLDADSFTKNGLLQQFSPRASLSYALSPRLKLSSSVGRYFKILPYTALGFQLDQRFINAENPYTQSNHYVVGLQYYQTPSTLFSVEAFLKQYSNYPVSVIDQVSLANKGAGFEVLGNEPITSSGKGRSYGLELLYQQKLTNRFYGIFSYTFFYSQFSGLNNTTYLRSVWDSRHLSSFTGGYKLNRNWEISSRFRLSGRTPFAPVNQEATLERYPEIVLDYQQLGSDGNELNIFNQLDVRIDKKWNFKSSSFNLFFEIQNLLSSQLPTPPEFGLARDESGALLQPLSLSPIAQTAGQFIPSIGLVFDF